MSCDVMLDLETLGTSAGCVILSIGAVVFNAEAGELGSEFYSVINQQSCINSGLDVNEDTAKWWKQQSREAQRVLYETCEDNGPQLSVVLGSFSSFIEGLGDNVRVWGNGSDFDQPILAGAYKALNMPLPWKFWNNRCFRTIKNLRPDITFSRTGTYHNALDDAKTQAIHAIDILKQLTP